jgi:hypothetical protein
VRDVGRSRNVVQREQDLPREKKDAMKKWSSLDKWKQLQQQEQKDKDKELEAKVSCSAVRWP